MSTKGVDFYLYSDAADLRTDVYAPAIHRSHGPESNFQLQQLQIQSRHIPSGYIGRLQWFTRRNGIDQFTRRQDVHTLTGNLHNGDMKRMFNTAPRIGATTISWGFYDAGTGGGVSILTNRHQLYAYATRDQRRWMGDLAKRDPRVAAGPFYRFALPGAHDAGMFDTLAVRQILGNRRLRAALFMAVQFIPIVGPILVALGATAMGSRAIANLSMTQKDSVRNMLDVGTRYFDFRPGTMHPLLRTFQPNLRFHQHGMIPGQPYFLFLEEVLRWLVDNPGEIVVVSANTQGLADPAMHPSPADLEKDLETALARAPAAREIELGNKTHLDHSYAQLIRDKRRLFFLNQIAGETTKYDSWNGSYATLTPGPIIAAFEAMRPQVPNKEDYVVMQMQAMSTSMGRGVIIPAVFTESDASSPLLATKAVIDNATNPWLREHAARRLPQDRLLVFLNDFVDNCMTETAIHVTEQRARNDRADILPLP